MATVTGASLTPIYERLNSTTETPRHHPVNASTFSDWSMEAGDTVTLKRGDTDYKTPVHSSRMVWKGKTPQIEVNSTGNEKRDALTKVSRQKFGRSSGAIRTAGRQFNFEANQDRLLYEVFDQNGSMSKMQVDINGLNHEVYDAGGKYSKLYNTVNGLYNEVYDPKTGLMTQLQTQAGQFSVLCTGSGKNIKLKPASIQAGIDAATGNSKIILNATHVDVAGDSILLDGKTKLTGVLQVSNGVALLNGGATVSGGPLRLLSSSSLQINGPSSGMSYSLGYNDFVSMIVKAQVDGNVLKLWQRGNNSSTPSLTFSKATTLSGEWSGGRYTVVAKQNDIEVDTNTTRIVALTSNGEVTKVGKNVNRSYKVQYTQDNIHLYDTGFSAVISMNAESVYNDGYNDGYSAGQGSYTSKILRCTSVEQEYPGSFNHIYTFTIEGNFNFHANTNYTFYRTAW